jgi:predicted Zn-dependent protease with MMP-like domain
MSKLIDKLFFCSAPRCALGFALGSALAYCSSAMAGGPLILEGPSGTTPVTYQNPGITLHVENGTLGNLTNLEADALVTEAFALWNDVDTSTINLAIDQIQLQNIDIDINNFDSYLPTTNYSEFNADDNLNPIVYDNNGEIIDAFFGVGASDHTIGFAASIFTSGGSFFKEGYAVINGKDLNLTTTTFKLLITHEIGHFFGLDHTQVNIDNRETDFGSPSICSTTSHENYPVMYPFICRDVTNLHSDDISAVSALYPAANVSSNFGTLQGRFVDDIGLPILGANIWAENTTSGETFSVVSDYLRQNNGFYKMLLPAGNYTLHANSINPLFNGGSGVGPYTYDQNDISFQPPHPIGEVDYQGTTDDGNEEVIAINNGETVNINFSSSGSQIELISSDDDEDDSISDMFGATSHITLWILATLLLLGRRFSTKIRLK